MKTLEELQDEVSELKKKILEDSKAIFDLETQLLEYKRVLGEEKRFQDGGLTLFYSLGTKGLKESFAIDFQGDKVISGNRRVLEFLVKGSIFVGSSFYGWCSVNSNTHQFIGTKTLVLSNGSIYQGCWPLGFDEVGDNIRVRIGFESIQ